LTLRQGQTAAAGRPVCLSICRVAAGVGMFGAKAAKRHQAVSGYWHTLTTLARWCRIRSYLDSAAAHGLTALDAIRDAIEGKPWLPPLQAVS
jgi:hypothetical protein